MGFNRAIRKIMLTQLLRKPAPNTYIISLPEKEQKKYDFFSIKGATVEHTNIHIKGWDEESEIIEIMWWPEDSYNAAGTDDTCNFSDLKWSSLNVRQRFVTWNITYDSIREAFWHDILRFPYIKWWLQKFRNLFIKPVLPDFRMDLLKKIVELHYQSESIVANDLLVKIHGTAILLSHEQGRHLRNLMYILDSLKESGDIRSVGGEGALIGEFGVYAPTPKAAITIAEYNERSSKHKDIVRLSNGQLMLGIGMFMLALVSVLIEVREWLHSFISSVIN